MGKTLTAPYAYEMYFSVAGNTHMMRTEGSWFVRTNVYHTGLGQPTAKNLAKLVTNFEKSTQPGGVNAHLGVCTVMSASVRHNIDLGCPEAPIAKYTGPAFVLI